MVGFEDYGDYGAHEVGLRDIIWKTTTAEKGCWEQRFARGRGLFGGKQGSKLKTGY